MKYCSLLAGVAIVLSGCASTEVKVKPEDQIVGVWHLKDYGSGNYEYSQLGFTSSGRKCVVSVSMNGNGIPVLDYYDNTWKIKNGVLESTVGDSPSSSLPKGYLIKDNIKQLNANELVVQMDGYGAPLEKHQKLHGVNPERICQLVENYAGSLKRNNT
ncbi:MAG: hypothetical protein KC484_05885 [Colwelliaceae bacterium]|nr:hypothetical protein [Colwelliaceae bacterium]